MGLETGTYINSLVTTNPTGADLRSQGDDHIRLLKSTIKASFPDVDDAALTIHNKATAPSTPLTGTIWRDTTNSLWKFYNGSGWITLPFAFNTSNSVDVNAGTIDGVTLGTNSAVTEAQIDNINVNGNAITSTNSNGDLTITPNGTGEIILDGQKWPQADGSSTNYLTTNGAGQIAWTTNTVVTSETNASNSATTATAQAVIATAKAVLTAADVVSTNADVVSCNAVLDTFDDRFLGSKGSVPTVDNDGATLTDGALYFLTTTNRMFVYDLATTTWLQLAPSDADQANINVVAGNILYQEDLGSIADSVSSGSGSDISTVAGSIANINTVAGISSNITAVAGDATDIGVVAGKATEIGLLGTSAAVADLALVGVSSVITDMDLIGATGVIGNLATVATNVANVNLTGGSIANVNLTGGSIANVNTTAGSIANVNTVASNIAGVNSFNDRYRIASSAPASSLDAGDLYFDTTLNELKAYGTSWQSTAPSAANQVHINNVSGAIVYQEDLGSIADALSSSSSSGDIATVATAIANVNLTGSNIANVNLTGGSIANVNLTGGSISNVNTVAGSIADINRYAQEYTISSSTPTSPTPAEGDLWYDSTNNLMKYHNGSGFISIASGIADVESDTSPTLGGALDCNNVNITNCGTVSGSNLQMDFGSIA
jgi:hypothetical protein